MNDVDRFRAVSKLGSRLTNLVGADGYSLAVEFGHDLLGVTKTAAALGIVAPHDMDDLLQNGRGNELTDIVAAVASDPHLGIYVDLKHVERAPLVTRPRKMLFVGFNYRKHAEETHTKVSRVPDLFSKFTNSLNRDGGVIHMPTETARWFDYETELVIVMGEHTRDVPVSAALSHVAGYTIGNDFSCRDLQLAQTQIASGKIADESAPVGPWLVPSSMIRNPNSLFLRTTVNGRLRQNWTTGDMIWDCDFLVSYISSFLTLEPGDLIFTGTPQGVILGETIPLDQRRWLQPGDVVVSEIEDLGTLTCTCAAWDPAR